MKIIIKGGVWKNTEDEILKAAISKYGKNQWARISSLLVRKTPKQCKARWYEWLDPSIKKTEWSKTEDEKLLHLAKLMPTQWRTIAPIVGRTATQCLERYQYLLDEAEQRENEELGLAGPGEEAGPSSDVRKLKPGELDTDPETKPARPDPIDMDEDEKEMLSEARARLANTQGKKAKRKARERQLEEARRLAVLQKRRELKAAGIVMRHKDKKKGMDYNADIPFEKQPAMGFYDVADEQAKTYAKPVGKTVSRMENKRKPEDAEAERRKRQKKAQEGGNDSRFAAAREAQIQKLKEAEQISNRRRLELPLPQVGESELEEIVKIGQAGESARALVDEEGAESNASRRLLGDYSALGATRHARTPRTEQQEDNVMAEARNLRNMIEAQTPLLGEENTPLHEAAGAPGGTGYDGATPRHQVNFTPNPLATPRGAPGSDVGATPRIAGGVGATPLRTPMRDSLSINTADGASQIGDTPRERRMAERAVKDRLRFGFGSLPVPKNDFEIIAPEDENEELAAQEALSEEDAAERDRRLAAIAAEEERKELARRSQAVQRGLPRPADIDAADLLARLAVSIPGEDALGRAAREIDAELVRLVEHDSIAYPLPGTRHAGGATSDLREFEDDELAAARAAVHAELAGALGFPGANEEAVKRGILAAIEADVSDESTWASDKLVWSVDARAFVPESTLTPAQRIAGATAHLDAARARVARDAAKAAKQEKKLGVQLGGYAARSKALSKRLLDAFNAHLQTSTDLEAFSRLADLERSYAPARIARLQKEVASLERRERELQERHKVLEQEKRERTAAIEGLEEEKVMREAEELNEAALAADAADGAQDAEMAEAERDIGPMPA